MNRLLEPANQPLSFRIGTLVAGCVFGGIAVSRYQSSEFTNVTSGLPTAVLILNLVAACLFVVRRKSTAPPSVKSIAAVLPSIWLAGLIYAVATDGSSWPIAFVAIFIVGVAISSVSLLNLGRSFGILPASRGLVCSGCYKLIRHPAYFGELLMAFACLVAVLYQGRATVTAISAVSMFILLIPSVVWRIQVEEQTLSKSQPGWSSYAASTRYRLIPGLW